MVEKFPPVNLDPAPPLFVDPNDTIWRIHSPRSHSNFSSSSFPIASFHLPHRFSPFTIYPRTKLWARIRTIFHLQTFSNSPANISPASSTTLQPSTMSASTLQHKTTSPHTDTQPTPVSTINPHDLVAADHIANFKSIKACCQSTPETPHYAPLRRALNISLSIPHQKLTHILYGIYPITFPNFLRIQPLPVQSQLLLEIASIPQQYQDLTCFSTQLDQIPALALLYRQYLQYRSSFQRLQKPIFFHAHSNQTAFSGYYNRQETQLTQFKNNNEAFSHLFLTKTIPSMVSSFITTIATAKPHWVVMAHIPYDKTLQEVTAIASKVTGYSSCIMLPVEQTTMTKMAFLSYKTPQNRDNALEQLNGQLSDKFAVPNSKPDDKTSTKQDKSPSVFKLHVFPWVSTPQFESDLQTLKSQPTTQQLADPQTPLISTRQPITPVGLKQWTVGPISKQRVLSQIDDLLDQAFLTCQFFDYIRLIAPPTNITAILTHFNTITQKPPAQGSNIDTTANQHKLLKFQLFLKYLTSVHLFDFFTSTSYPSKEFLVSDIGEEWYIIDLPEISSHQVEIIEKGFITASYEAVYTTPAPPPTTAPKNPTNARAGLQQSNTAYSQWKMQADVISNQTTFYSNGLRTIPIDPTLSSQNRSLTCFYNAIFACSPPQKLPDKQQPTTPNNHTPVSYNFWQLEGFYQNQFFSPTSSNPDTKNLPNQLTSPFTATSSQLPPTHGQTKPRPLSTTDEFWASISSVTETIKSFDPDTMQVTPDTVIDSIDPDLYYFASTLSPISPNYTPPSSYPLVSSPIPPIKATLPPVFAEVLKTFLFSQYFKAPAKNRFQCKLCSKVMVSIQTMIKHITAQHSDLSDDVLVEFMKNQLYFRYLCDENASSYTPPSLSASQLAFTKRYFVYESPSSLKNEMNDHNDDAVEKRKTELLKVNYAHQGLSFFKRNLLARDKIDSCWDQVLTMYRALVDKLRLQCENHHKVAGKKKELRDEAKRAQNANMDDIDESGSHMIVWGAARHSHNFSESRNLQLEERAEKLRKAQKVAKLFKGIDGDNVGETKDAKIEWTSLGDISGEIDETSGQTTISTRFIESIQSFLILDHAAQNRPQLDYSDIPEAHIHVLSPDFGLEPFVGQ